MNTSYLQMNNIALYHFRVSILINGALIIIWFRFGSGGLIISTYGKEKLQRHQEAIQDIIPFITRQNKKEFYITKAISIHRDNLLESGHTVVAILTHAHEASI